MRYLSERCLPAQPTAVPIPPATTKIPEFKRWLSDKKVVAIAMQEAQLAGGTVSVQGYQDATISRKARGRRDGGPVKGGDVCNVHTYVLIL